MSQNSTPPSYSSSTRPHGTPPGSRSRQQHDVPILIAVMGATGTGKTSFINMASGSGLRVGKELESCTSEVQPADEFILDGRRVILIDTPGFDDTNKSDINVLALIATFLATAYQHGSRLAGVIYIHDISDKRFKGIAKRNFQMFRELCGDSTLKSVSLVTNMWGGVSQEDGEKREQQLANIYFKPALDKGASLVRHLNTVQSAHDIIRGIIKKRRQDALRIQRELVDEGRDIRDTAAGQVINKELNDQIRLHQAELAAVKEGMEKALKEKDEETRRELEEETQQLQEYIEKTKMDLETITSKYDEEKKRIDDEVRKVQEQARREQEAHQREMDELRKQLESASGASAAEKEALQEQIDQLQHQWDNRPNQGGFWGAIAGVATAIATAITTAAAKTVAMFSR